MTSQQPEIRSITSRAELEAVYDVLGNVFPDGRDFFKQRLDHDSGYDWSTTWLALQEGELASTIQVFPFTSRVGTAALKVGGIGSVATVPAYRGQGHCRQMLHRITGWLEQQQYDLSLLFASINPFYEKAGWSIVPETMYELKPADITVFNADMMVSNDEEYDIVPFDSSHAAALAAIYEKFNNNRAGMVVRPPSFWRDCQHWPKWKASSCMVALRGGVVVAYGLISAIEQDGTAYIDELCCLEGKEQAALSLFQALSWERREAQRLLINLPADHVLMSSLQQWGAVKQMLTYMMWKVISFQPLVAKLAVVLENRLQASSVYAGQSLQLEWSCSGQTAYLHYADGRLTVESAPREAIQYLSISVAQADFVRLLLQGYDKFAEDFEYSSLLEALFPKQNNVFYLMDRF